MGRKLPFKKISDLFINHLSLIMIFIGSFLIILAVIFDHVSSGSQVGFGQKQIFILTCGVVILLSGIYLFTPSGRRAQNGLIDFLRIKEIDPLTTDRKDIFSKILITAVWFGLSVGFGEALFRIITKLFQNKVLYMSQHFVWMLPLVEIAIFASLGLIIFCFSLVLPKIASIRFLVFIFSLVSLITLHYIQPRLNIYAALVLYIGVSFQLSRFLGSRAITFLSFERRSVPWMLTFLFVIMAGMIGWLG